MAVFTTNFGKLGQTFVARLVMRLKYKDGHKTDYASGRTFLEISFERHTTKGSSSGRMSAPRARLYTRYA